MLEKARTLTVDEVLLDLEDAVAADARPAARRAVAEALVAGGFIAPTVSVRVSAWATPDTVRDLLDGVAAVVGDDCALRHVDTVTLPKVRSAADVEALHRVLAQLETEAGLLPGTVGVEAQIEDAVGLRCIDEIAAAPRVEALVLGPADMVASLGTRTRVPGDAPDGYPADALHTVHLTMIAAARAAGIQAIDGPYVRVRDLEAFSRVARQSAALGYDGKWVVHPDQVDAGNEIFTPDQHDFDHAVDVLDAYAYSVSTAGGARGAVMMGDVMLDEASRAMAQDVVARGAAAGLVRSRR